jgi:hypothetical protein
VNARIKPFGSALNAALNFDWSNVNLPSLSTETPARPGEPGLPNGTASVNARVMSPSSRVVVGSPVSGEACFVSGSYAVAVLTAATILFAASTSACTRAARLPTSRLTVTVTGAADRLFSCSVTPGSTPLTVLFCDVTSYEPAPVPTVIFASVACVSSTSEPTAAVNSLAAMFGPPNAPVVFELICSRYVPCPTCTAVAVTPACAALMFATTAASVPSPTVTLFAVTVPVRSPPENDAVMVPAAALSTTDWPASIDENSCSAASSTCTLPLVPTMSAPSVLRCSLASAVPPVMRSVAAEPSRSLAIRSPFVAASTVTVTGAPFAVAAAWIFAARSAGV